MNNSSRLQPFISIIIPYYNSEQFLRRCAESIMVQNYPNLEIILVNDGSSDGSVSLADSLAAEDHRIINYTVPHGGVSAARNAGLRIATGELVMFVDSDDWIADGILERMAAVMEESGADLVCCEISRTEGTEPAVLSGPLKYDTCSQEDFLRLFFKIETNEWVHFPVAKLYRRALLPQPLYPVNIRVGEDVLGTYLAIASARTIARLRETGYYYFLNPVSATSQFTEKDFDLITVWDKVVETTSGKEPDHSYAVINRDRINFTLLFRMITEVPAKEIRLKYSSYQKQLLRDLRRCEKELLHSPIVTSRKILIFILCHFYPLAAFFGNLLVRISRLTGNRFAVAQRRPLS